MGNPVPIAEAFQVFARMGWTRPSSEIVAIFSSIANIARVKITKEYTKQINIPSHQTNTP